MDEKRKVKVSKYLSKYLRHSPEAIGLNLDPAGWIAVDDLLAACEKSNFPVTYEELTIVVAENDKKRFAFSDDGRMIRASQGHSIDVELGYTESEPPDFLYHGTTVTNQAIIDSTGLKKMNRHHVHLSKDLETASKVGLRHGKLLVYRVNTASMFNAGFKFYCSANGVWLTDFVPPEYLEVIK